MAFKLRKPPQLSTKYDAYPYQLDAVRAVKSLPYAAIFHEQGLGKTKIATDLMLLWLGEDVVDTVFVVTKKTLVQNWVDELVNHSFVTPRVLAGNRRENSIALNSPVLIYIMNYEVISTNLDLTGRFLKTCRVGAILDESQKIKNPEARLSICLHSIAKDFVRRVIMTGTPVANRPYDIWSQIKFLDDGAALGRSFADFKAAYDLPSKPVTVSGHDYPDLPVTEEQAFPTSKRVAVGEYAKRLGDIMDRIKDFSVRETKETAGIELPDKSILTYAVELAPRQSAIYASYRDQLTYDLQRGGSRVIDDAEELLKRLLRLVQCASNPALLDDSYNEIPAKYSKLLELLESIKIQANKAIVWTGFIDNVEWLSNKLDHLIPEKVHGSISIAERNESIRKFKTDKNCRILLATPGAAKEGLTLTVANHAIFFDRSFSLDDYLQAQDRIHRISQTENCFVHNLIAKNTIDEWVDTLLNAKYQAAQLTQGDISRKEFDSAFAFDLSGRLSELLSSHELV